MAPLGKLERGPEHLLIEVLDSDGREERTQTVALTLDRRINPASKVTQLSSEDEWPL